MCVRGCWDANPRHPRNILRNTLLSEEKHVVTVVVKDKGKCYVVKSSAR